MNAEQGALRSAHATHHRTAIEMMLNMPSRCHGDRHSGQDYRDHRCQTKEAICSVQGRTNFRPGIGGRFQPLPTAQRLLLQGDPLFDC